MAVSYKNIVITPNRSSVTGDPKIVFSGANTSANTDVQLRALPDDGGVVQFELTDNTALLTISSNNKLTIANSVKLIANGSAGSSGDMLTSNGTGVYWKAISDLNTTYDHLVVSGTGYANVRLHGSDSSNDDIKFVGSGATTVSYTDADTITISSTDNNTTYVVNSASNTTSANVILTPSSGSNTQVKFVGSGATTVSSDGSTITISSTDTDTNTTYDLLALSTTGGANVRLSDSSNANDDIKFTGTGSVSVSVSGNTITFNGTDNNTTYTVNSASNTTSANVILTPSSGSNTQIKLVGSGATTVSSDGNTITISSTDTDTNTTYDLSTLATTGGANVRLSDSSNSNDDIKFTGSGSVTVSVSGNTITFTGTDNNTTYSVNAISGSGYANLRLYGTDSSTDDIKFQPSIGGGISISSSLSDTIDFAVNTATSLTWSVPQTFNANLTANDVIISGNLTVSGTTTYVNSTQLNIGDNIVSLNADLSGASSPSENAGIEVNRGSSSNASFLWNETSDVWQTYDGTNIISIKAGNSTIIANSSGIYANAAAIDTDTTYSIDSASNTTSANVILIPSSGSNTQVKFVGSGATVVSSDGDTITISSTDTNTDTNTTYDLLALSTTGGANVRLSDSSSSNDDIKFTGSGSVTVSVSGNTITFTGTDNNTTYTIGSVSNTTSANVILTPSSGSNTQVKLVGSGATSISTDGTTITISSTDTDTNTTYDQVVVSGTGYANLRLHASDNANDDVKFIGSGTVSVARTDADTITITGTGATPAGANTEIQYNLNGSLGANAQFTINVDTPILTVGNTSSTLTPTLKAINATSNAVMTSASFAVGNSTIQSNLQIGTLNIGNSTVNTVINQTNAAFFTNSVSTALYIASNGNVGVSTASPTYNLQVNGSFAAVTKSFLIDHPSKKGYKLRYGSLESPYHGIRLTGSGEIKNGKVKIDLPTYIKKLVREEDSQVQLTNYKHGKILWVDSIDVDKNSFTVKMDREKGDKEVYKFFWDFTAIRKDIEEMIVEFKDED